MTKKGIKQPLRGKKVGGESNSFTSRGGVMHDKRLEVCSSSPCQARLQPHSLTAVNSASETHRPKACRCCVFNICNGRCQRLSGQANPGFCLLPHRPEPRVNYPWRPQFRSEKPCLRKAEHPLH